MFDRFAIVSVYVGDDVPAIGMKTFHGVVGKPALYLAVDRDAVVIVDCNQLVQAKSAGKGAYFVRNAFHQAAVTKEDIGVMVYDIVARPVELTGKGFFSYCHAYAIRYPLA